MLLWFREEKSLLIKEKGKKKQLPLVMLSDIICLLTQHNGPSTLAPTQVLENTSLLGLARLNSFAEYVICLPGVSSGFCDPAVLCGHGMHQESSYFTSAY